MGWILMSLLKTSFSSRARPSFLFYIISFMSSVSPTVRLWNILCWNIRGLNGDDKWTPLRDKIDESNAAVVCLQETKMMHFDNSTIRKFAPKRFDRFISVPSNGASGGLLILWNSAVFAGSLIMQETFGVVVNLHPPCPQNLGL